VPTPFIGPTYALKSRPASVQRTVNMFPVPLEPGNERTDYTYRDVPGLRPFSTDDYVPPPISGLFYANFEDGLPRDLTADPAPYSEGATAVISGGEYKSEHPIEYLTAQTIWEAEKFNQLASSAFTIEGVCRFAQVADATVRSICQLTWGVPRDQSYRLYYYSASAKFSFSDPNDLLSAGTIRDLASGVSGRNTHFALVVPAGPTPTARLYVNGAYIGSAATATVVTSANLPQLIVGNATDQGDEDYSLLWLKITLGELYTGTGSISVPVEEFEA
jgi:hypothetical protein